MADEQDDQQTRPDDEPSGNDETAAPRESKSSASSASLEAKFRVAEGAPWWEPGVVEVEFRDWVRPEVEFYDDAYLLTSRGERDLSGLNQVLQAYNLLRAEVTAGDMSWDEADRMQARAMVSDPEVPNLRNFVTLHFPEDAPVFDIAADLNRREEVRRAVPVPKGAPPSSAPNEPLLGQDDQVTTIVIGGECFVNQWYIFRCEANKVWDMGITGRGVVIADIDWGFRDRHRDLINRLDPVHRHNSCDGSTVINQGNAILHGTGVMGLVGAGRDGFGMAGFAYDADLWPVQANFGVTGPPLPGNAWVDGINWVLGQNSDGKPKVILFEREGADGRNIEWQPSINGAIRNATGNGVVVCVPAGNGGVDAGIDPLGAQIPPTGSILVGATEYDPSLNPRLPESNWGRSIVISAPGDTVFDTTCSSDDDTAYTQAFGKTSGAAAKVAGAVALMLQADNSLSPSEVKTILTQTAKEIIVSEPDDPTAPRRWKFLDCCAAVQAVCCGLQRSS